MLIGTAGLLGGVIGPVIAPAEEVLAVSSRSGAKAKAGGSGGKAAPLGTSERKPGPSKKKSGGKGSGSHKPSAAKLKNELDSGYPVPFGNGLYHENALGKNAGKLSIKGWITYAGSTNKSKSPMVGKPFGGKKGSLGWTYAPNVKSETGTHDIYVYERGYNKKAAMIDETATNHGHVWTHYAPDDKHGAGKIGMYYTNKNSKKGAGTFYDITTHKSTPVDFRLTYLGGNNQANNITAKGLDHSNWNKKGSWTWKNGKKMALNPVQGDGRYLAFSSRSLGVFDLGRGTDKFKLDIINHKTGQPLAYNGPISFWDIDVGQGLKVSKSNAYLYASSKKQGNDVGPTMVTEGKSGPFGGFVKGIWTEQNKNKDQFSRQGTVANDDPRGAFTAVTGGGSSYELTFDRYGKGDYIKAKPIISPKTKPFTSVPKVTNSRAKSGDFYGNWFGIGSNTNIAQGKIDHGSANSGKMVSSTIKPGDLKKGAK